MDSHMVQCIARIGNIEMFCSSLKKSKSYRIQEVTRLCFFSVVHRPLTNMVPENKFWRSPELVFWGSPDLVAQLLTILDVPSTLALANVLPLAQQLLQRQSIWGNLISRSNFKRSPYEEGNMNQKEDWDRWEEMNNTEVSQLAAILKMVNDPELLLLMLLDTICERFPSDGFGFQIIMTCSRHPGHDVDQHGWIAG